MPIFKLSINGKQYQPDVAEDTPLLWVLRDHLGLVGTKYGCGIAQCGACTVHVNGTAVRSCVLPVSSVKNSAVTTIEGLSANGDHPLQTAWDEVDVAQCGYCQSGQLMTAAALLKKIHTLVQKKLIMQCREISAAVVLITAFMKPLK